MGLRKFVREFPWGIRTHKADTLLDRMNQAVSLVIQGFLECWWRNHTNSVKYYLQLTRRAYSTKIHRERSCRRLRYLLFSCHSRIRGEISDMEFK